MTTKMPGHHIPKKDAVIYLPLFSIFFFKALFALMCKNGLKRKDSGFPGIPVV
jgi:hypothetical protein